jgi:transposase InsO family protein
VRYAFIRHHRRIWPVALLCRLLQVTRSGYYAWRVRPVSPTRRWRTALLSGIRRIHLASRRTYGSPRVYRELIAQGHSCCVNSVARLMKVHEIRAKTKRRFRVKTTDSKHPYPVAPNRLERCFRQEAPNRAWVGDITYVATREGWLYVAVVLDLFSRRVIGWAFGATLEATLATQALQMAIKSRAPAEGMLMHTDRGVQYACRAYQEMLAEHRLTCSMSRPGNCYDNAVSESFYKTLKVELVNDECYATRNDARSSIFEYIEGFYNRQRLHSALGYLSPEAFEAGH